MFVSSTGAKLRSLSLPSVGNICASPQRALVFVALFAVHAVSNFDSFFAHLRAFSESIRAEYGQTWCLEERFHHLYISAPNCCGSRVTEFF